MIQPLLKDILSDKNTRQNLSTLRQEIKQLEQRFSLLSLMPDHITQFATLLHHEDAKTRKNAALLMGDLGMQEFLPMLFEGYQQETQRFVKSAYLIALQSFDCSPYLDELKAQLDTLAATPLTEENKKHIQEEMRALSTLLIQEEGIDTHTFTGYQYPLDCILLTNRLHKNLLEQEITKGELVPFAAGVRVRTTQLDSLLDFRTYSEILFVIPQLATVSANPTAAAKTIANSRLISLLTATHLEKTPFYFRIELKTKMPLNQKSIFAKKLASELESATNRKLLNTTSNYEVELRLIENKAGTFNVLLKLATIPDERFSYRKETVAASIRPVGAAQLVALAKDYMIENSRTLDPFCGVGTMLIERQKVVKGNTSYGIDIYAPAIEKAKINTEAAGQIIHYVNRDFFDFTHEHVFDEIFTNMPFATGHKSEDEIETIYRKFFPKAKELLTPNGTIILYSHNRDLVRKLSRTQSFQILEDIEVMKKEGTGLFIIRF